MVLAENLQELGLNRLDAFRQGSAFTRFLRVSNGALQVVENRKQVRCQAFGGTLALRCALSRGAFAVVVPLSLQPRVAVAQVRDLLLDRVEDVLLGLRLAGLFLACVFRCLSSFFSSFRFLYHFALGFGHLFVFRDGGSLFGCLRLVLLLFGHYLSSSSTTS